MSIIASTGFSIDNSSLEYFLDDDGNGNIRIFYLVAGVRTYYDTLAGTVDYTSGIIRINNVKITSVSDVDEVASTRFRVTVIPDSNDVIPVRNQLLEIDLSNTTVGGTIDPTATTGKGYTVTTSGTTTTTTVATTSSVTSTTSGY